MSLRLSLQQLTQSKASLLPTPSVLSLPILQATVRGLSVAGPIIGDIHLYPIFLLVPLQEQKPMPIFLNQQLTQAWHRDQGTRTSLSKVLLVLCTLSVAFCLSFHSS